MGQPAVDIQALFTQAFRVKGRPRGLKLDGGLSKVARFCICSKSVRSVIKEVGIDPYNSLPIYCPLILFDLTLKIDQSGSMFYVERIHQCQRLFGKDGIPKLNLLKVLPKDKRKKLEYVPDKIRSPSDLDLIEGDLRIIATLKGICAPYFRRKVFFDLLRYFPYSLLKRFTDIQLKKLLDSCKKNPTSMCFRESLSRIVMRLEGEFTGKPDTMRKYGVVYSQDSTSYSLTKWMHLGSEERRMKFDGSCPMWNVSVMKNFSDDHGIECEQPRINFIHSCIYFYVACEREKAIHRSTCFKTIGRSKEMLCFFSENNLLTNSDKIGHVSSPQDSENESEFVFGMVEYFRSIQIVNYDATLDDMFDSIIQHYSKSMVDGKSTMTIVMPHASNVLYMLGKFEKGDGFRRDKPKRGRKRKIQEVKQNKPEEQEKAWHGIYFLEQWLEAVKSKKQLELSNLVIFNSQEFTCRQFVEIFSALKQANAKGCKLTILGNSSLWCTGTPSVFNCLTEKFRVVKYDCRKKKTFDVNFLFSNSIAVKKCDIYENIELFSDSLVEFFKQNDVKWCSKAVMFTNETLMNKIATLTSNSMLRLGLKEALYLDALIKVEHTGIFGVVKKASIFTPNGVLRDITDQSVPIFPALHRYIMKVEDYYSKSLFTVDTKYDICSNPVFTLVRDSMAVPYEFVILVADNTTTKRDISRAAELSKGTLLLYYKKGIDIGEVLKNEVKVPSLGLKEVLDSRAGAIKFKAGWTV